MASRKSEAAEIDEMLKTSLEVASSSSPGTGSILVSATRSDLTSDLRSFGEDSVADQVQLLSQTQLRAIFERAGQLSEGDLSLPRVLCLAAVEIVEGNPRPLARKRRKSAI